ncbi:peptidase M22, glycoprotease [Tilletiaria anomala UBC 951]|uniref:N(6)-L-threonylcarbamoyladenine synthase n=1 Tax=Tilletiaria anomala (strain ATCC 24038 / CBS 436.72 / UBC 951) TaxID=1037660 RepID=A0A066VFA7_TILAU|nr:peptidase M22, glycoprotease [Tilletiaria anomala UBC 951]KDN40161.1 peptidase M22, glycoprotease [Tilletiaria anomala UBC 951]
MAWPAGVHSAAISQARPRLLSNVVLRQDHSATGGIHPYHAAIWHGSNVPQAVGQALQIAAGPSHGWGASSILMPTKYMDGQSLSPKDIDAIAVTRGPGMMASLSNGMVAAKTLASVWNKPLIYVHHMAAHALTPFFTEESPPAFPFLTLLVSGGHTMLVLAESVQKYQILATTSDDSIGDAFDKAARDMGIPWGGNTAHSNPGAALEAFAAAADITTVQELKEHLRKQKNIALPSAMRGQLAFSYSGLKATVTRAVQALPSDVKTRRALAHLFQEAAVAQISEKLRLVLQRTLDLPIKDVVCSGGVASNSFLRQHLRDTLDAAGKEGTRLLFPPLEFCTDNAAMIAHTGLLFYEQRTHDLSIQPVAKWNLEDL